MVSYVPKQVMTSSKHNQPYRPLHNIEPSFESRLEATAWGEGKDRWCERGREVRTQPYIWMDGCGHCAVAVVAGTRIHALIGDACYGQHKKIPSGRRLSMLCACRALFYLTYAMPHGIMPPTGKGRGKRERRSSTEMAQCRKSGETGGRQGRRGGHHSSAPASATNDLHSVIEQEIAHYDWIASSSDIGTAPSLSWLALSSRVLPRPSSSSLSVRAGASVHSILEEAKLNGCASQEKKEEEGRKSGALQWEEKAQVAREEEKRARDGNKSSVRSRSVGNATCRNKCLMELETDQGQRACSEKGAGLLSTGAHQTKAHWISITY